MKVKYFVSLVFGLIISACGAEKQKEVLSFPADNSKCFHAEPVKNHVLFDVRNPGTCKKVTLDGRNSCLYADCNFDATVIFEHSLTTPTEIAQLKNIGKNSTTDYSLVCNLSKASPEAPFRFSSASGSFPAWDITVNDPFISRKFMHIDDVGFHGEFDQLTSKMLNDPGDLEFSFCYFKMNARYEEYNYNLLSTVRDSIVAGGENLSISEFNDFIGSEISRFKFLEKQRVETEKELGLYDGSNVDSTRSRHLTKLRKGYANLLIE